MASGLGSATRNLFAGGRTPSLLNRIDYIQSTSTGNFADFGDLTVARYAPAGVSDSHGGITD